MARSQIFFRTPLEAKSTETRSILAGSWVGSGAGVGGMSGVLLVPMLLNGGCGYAQLRFFDLFPFKRWL